MVMMRRGDWSPQGIIQQKGERKKKTGFGPSKNETAPHKNRKDRISEDNTKKERKANRHGGEGTRRARGGHNPDIDDR